MTQLDTTIKALADGLTQFTAKKGSQNVARWMETLEHEEFRGAKVIRSNLKKLKALLDAPAPDGPAIAGLLRALGAATGRAAAQAGTEGERVSQLAEMLKRSATGLG